MPSGHLTSSNPPSAFKNSTFQLDQLCHWFGGLCFTDISVLRMFQRLKPYTSLSSKLLWIIVLLTTFSSFSAAFATSQISNCYLCVSTCVSIVASDSREKGRIPGFLTDVLWLEEHLLGDRWTVDTRSHSEWNPSLLSLNYDVVSVCPSRLKTSGRENR